MLKLFVVLISIGSTFCYPKRRLFDDPDPFAGAFAGPFGTFAGASLGFPFFGWSPFQPTWVPIFTKLDIRPWYEGPNVCEKKKIATQKDAASVFGEEDESYPENLDFRRSSEICQGDNKKYVCYKRETNNEESRLIQTVYTCCYGFVSSPNGCVEIDLRYLIPTLRNMGASQLVKIIERVNMADSFYVNNYTVFCPPSTALETFYEDIDNNIDNDLHAKITLLKIKKKTKLYKFLTSHITSGFYTVDDMKDEQIVQMVNTESRLRINIYYIPEKVVTANCVPIMSGDIFARNGIVHVVEKLLPSPSKTVADIIAGDSQFSILKGMLGMAGLVQTLRNPNGSFTMFAPTDAALSSALAQHKTGNPNRCTVSVMKHHIIDHVVCSAAFPQHARSLNMIGELLSLTRDRDNKLYVDGVQIVVRDLMATNGVVHVIDGILSTRQTKTISQVLEDSGLREFLSLLESADLKSEFDNMENVTFFIPTDEVIQGIPSKHLESFLSHNESILDVLRFHVVEGQTELNAPDQTFNSKLENATIRVQIHTKYTQMTPQALVQCASVLSANNKLCGGTLYVIDKLLLPPKITIIDFLESVDGFSTFVLLLRATGLDKRLREKELTHTLLAPTDDAFHQMGDKALFSILENIERAMELVKMHILLGTVCCNRLKSDLLSGRQQTRSMDGSLLTLERSPDGILMVGGAHIVDCDIMATNGVVHMLDTVVHHESIAFLGGGYIDNVFNLI